MKPQFLIPTVLAVGVRYLLNDSFNDTLTAGNVNGTPATPGPGTRTATETDGELSIGSGVLSFPAQSTPTWGDQGLHYADVAITRAFGQIFVAKLNLSTWEECGIGFDGTAAADDPDNFENAIQANTTDGQLDDNDGTAIITGLSTSTDYKLAIVLRASGAYYFIKGGAYTSWTLLWSDSDGATATLYTVFSNLDGVGTLDNWRTPQTLWTSLPCLAYTEFLGDNGTSLDALDTLTTGPDGQTATSRSWMEQSGDWDIQTNKASYDAGADGEKVVTVDVSEADVVFDVDTTIEDATGRGHGIIARFTDSTHFWMIVADDNNNEIGIWENDAGYTKRASTAVAVAAGNTYAMRAICDGQVIDGFLDGGNKCSYGSAALNETETVHGLRGYTDGGTVESTFDNFTIFSRASGYSQLDKYTR